MTFEEAIKDPRRPLSMSPRDWMLSVEAELAEEEELVDKSAMRIASEMSQEDQQLTPVRENGWEMIDIGIDQIIQGCQILDKGLWQAGSRDLNPAARAILNNIKDLLDTAIVPYMADMVKESEKIS